MRVITMQQFLAVKALFDPEQIRDVCMDMSAAFRKGAQETLPNAEITYDRFHVAKLAGEGVDEVRRAEQARTGALTGTRFLWLKNPQKGAYA
jgi:transposase